MQPPPKDFLEILASEKHWLSGFTSSSYASGWTQKNSTYGNARSAPSDLKPMGSFDPSVPALLYDELNDELFEWQPERPNGGGGASPPPEATTWLDSWKAYAAVHDTQRDVWEWNGLLIAGWKPIEGGSDSDVRPL